MVLQIHSESLHFGDLGLVEEKDFGELKTIKQQSGTIFPGFPLAKRLNALAGLAEDLSSVSGTHTRAHDHL